MELETVQASKDVSQDKKIQENSKDAEDGGQRKKTARKRNRNKKNDKLDAMNNFLLKMHGDVPTSSASTQGSKSNNNK